MVTLADVVQLRFCLATVVVSAVVPVAVHSSVPEAVFNRILARGKTVPTEAVFLIHRLKLRVEPLGITPAALGVPVWVSNSLITYSPAVLPVSELVSATLPASGPAVSSSLKLVLTVDASLCRRYGAVCAPANVGARPKATTRPMTKLKTEDLPWRKQWFTFLSSTHRGPLVL